MNYASRIAGLRALIPLLQAFTTVVEARYVFLRAEIGNEVTAKEVNRAVVDVESTYRRNLRWMKDASRVVVGQFAWSPALAKELNDEMEAIGWGGHLPLGPYVPEEEVSQGTPEGYLAPVLFVLEQAGRDYGTVKVRNITQILDRWAAAPTAS